MAFINRALNHFASFKNLTAATTLTNSDTGKIFGLGAGSDVILPAPAQGLNFTFIVTTAPSGEAYTVTSNGTTQNVIYGCSVSAADAGGSGAGTNATAVDIVTFVDGQAKIGDYLWMVCDGTYWYAYAIVQDEDAVTFA